MDLSIAAAGAVLSLLLLAYSVYLLFFLPSRRHRVLLAYEDSRLFTPFVISELYCDDYPKLRWWKLRQLLLSFILIVLALLAFVLLGVALLHHVERLPFAHSLVLPLPVITGIAVACNLLLCGYALFCARKLKRYYRQQSFYHQSAISESELEREDGVAKGMRGEYYAWRLFQLLPQPRHILISPLVPKPGGSFSEIDLVVLSRKGIFCVEAKNREGMFMPAHHSETPGQWVHVQSSNESQKARIKNIQSPLTQNQHHIWTLCNFWKIDQKYFFNVLCFGDNADLRRAMPGGRAHSFDKEGSLLYYGQRNKLYRIVSELPDILGESLIERLYKEISAECQMSRIHRESLLNERRKNWRKPGSKAFKRGNKPGTSGKSRNSGQKR